MQKILIDILNGSYEGKKGMSKITKPLHICKYTYISDQGKNPKLRVSLYFHCNFPPIFSPCSWALTLRGTH